MILFDISIKNLHFFTNPMYSLNIVICYAIILIIIILLNRKHIITRLLIVLLLVIISQRPMLKGQNTETYKMDLDVLFVIDNTVSMNAIDANNMTRLEAVKKDCQTITNKLNGANFALITYGNIAQVKYPFTNDKEVVLDIIQRMKIIDPNYAIGSSLDLPYEYMEMLLNSSNSKNKHQRIVFFMGDGELSESAQKKTNLSKYASLQKLINNGAVLGYGSKEGGKVKITESYALEKLVDSSGFLLDGKDNPPKVAISKLNENNLKTLASNLSLEYFHMNNSSQINDKLNQIIDGAVKDKSDDEKVNYDLYYFFSIPLILLLLLELFHYRRDEQ